MSMSHVPVNANKHIECTRVFSANMLCQRLVVPYLPVIDFCTSDPALVNDPKKFPIPAPVPPSLSLPSFDMLNLSMKHLTKSYIRSHMYTVITLLHIPGEPSPVMSIVWKHLCTASSIAFHNSRYDVIPGRHMHCTRAADAHRRRRDRERSADRGASRDRVRGRRGGLGDRRSGAPRARREGGSSKPGQGPVRPRLLIHLSGPAIWRFAGLF